MKRLLIAFFLLPGLAHAATGDITGVEISPSGAEPFGACADITIDGFTTGKVVDFGSGYGNQLDYDDLGSAKIVFTVVSEGYDSTGTLGTVTRTVYATSVVRKPYPNEADDQEPSATVIRVALSDFIYLDDNTGAGKSGTAPTVTIAAGAIRNDGGSLETSAAATALTCTNSSGLDYAPTIARWDRVAGVVTADRISADFTMAVRAYHRSGIAAVRFDATGQTSAHNENSTTTTRTATQRVGSSLWAEAYHSALTDINAFTDDELIDLRFRAYPVVGDADNIRDSNNHTTSTEECLGYNKATVVCDDDADSTLYAVVDPVSGNNTTGANSATLATAESTPYLNIGEAVKDGANTIYLLDGTHAAVGSTHTRRTTNEWVVVTHHPTSSSKAGAIVQVTTTQTYDCERLQFKNVTFDLASTTSYMDGEDAGNFLRLTGVNFDEDAVGAPTTGIGYRSHATYLENCTGDMGEQEWDWEVFSSAKVNYLFDGCAFGTPGTSGTSNSLSAYELVACSSLDSNLYFSGTNTGGPVKDHVEISFNNLLDFSASGSEVLYGLSTTSGDDVVMGMAIVGNVIEKTAGTSALGTIAADSSACDAANVLIFHNTFSGERLNVGYNETGTTARLRRNWSQKYNSFRSWNVKTDTFAGTPSGARTGNWPIVYGVGFAHNNREISTFPGEYGGLDLTSGTPGYVADNSYTGTGTGNGDYAPDTGSVLLGRIPNGQRVVTIDLYGNEVVNEGDIGAIQVTTGPVIAGSTGWVLFGSIGQSVSAAADGSNLSDALVDDSNTLDVTLDDSGVYESEYFNFTNIVYGTTIPTGAPSYTVEFRIKRKSDTSSAREVQDLTVQFIDDTGTRVGDNVADTVTDWPSTLGTVDYVATGLSLDGTEFTSAAGLALRVTGINTNGSTLAEVAYAAIRISWTGSDPLYNTRGFFALTE